MGQSIVSRREGYALLTVLVFILILLIAGVGYFAISSYETKGALQRERSSEAFYLADGAIERARAMFLQDRSWRDGWSGIPTGNGQYDLAVSDTSVSGYDATVNLLGTGRVQGITRRVEVLADVPPTAMELPILVMGDGNIGGNLCLNGDGHFNGDPGSAHITCGGDYTSGFDIKPPPIYTDPAHFPNATYYYVKGLDPTHAKIFDASGNDITGTNTMNDVTTYNNASKTFVFSFDSPTKIANYFDDSSPTAVFKRNPGDIAVVVNFGEVPLYAGAMYSSLVFDGNANSDIHATIINTRFIGTTEEERVDYRFWAGDSTKNVPEIQLKQITFEPYTGIAMIGYNLNKQGATQCYVGTTSTPALTYICHNVDSINANFDLVGSLICLNDFNSTGGPNLTYDDGFIANLPDYLREDWPDGVSGTLKVLRWREIAAN